MFCVSIEFVAKLSSFVAKDRSKSSMFLEFVWSRGGIEVGEVRRGRLEELTKLCLLFFKR